MTWNRIRCRWGGGPSSDGRREHRKKAGGEGGERETGTKGKWPQTLLLRFEAETEKGLQKCDSEKYNQENAEEINPEYSLEGLMLKLKLQYSGHLI